MVITDLAMHPEKFVLVDELAAYWRVSERAVYYWINKGALKASRVGRVYRIRTVDAIEFGRIEPPVMGPVASTD